MTENGFSVKGEASKPLDQVINDTERITFYKGYVNAAIDAVEQDEVLQPSPQCNAGACLAVVVSGIIRSSRATSCLSDHLLST